MSDPTYDTSQQEVPSPEHKRVVYLFAWIGILVGMCLWLKSEVREYDPGVVNAVNNVAVILSAVGFAVWAISSSGWGLRTKWVAALGPVALLSAFYARLLPVEVINDGDVGFVGWRWRWDQPDKQLDMPAGASETLLDWQTTDSDYPRFLGNGYWAEVPGVTLDTDWQVSPPKELWRKKIGAGWSAFAIVGNYAVTQEQRDEHELVTCYEVKSGEIVWTHSDSVRWDPSGAGSMGYVGPRATPTIYEGRVFTLGATGILNCIDASSGTPVWSHDTLEQHGAKNVMWGKACSPLIVGEMVVVSVGGDKDQSLVAYDIESGNAVWAAGTHQSSYASPVLAELAGLLQVIVVNQQFVTAHHAASGEVLWDYEWPSDSYADGACSQPVPLEGDRVFFSKGYGHGSALVQVTRDESSKWQAEPLWKGRQYGQLPVMKTKMGNVLIRDNYVYGLDDVNLECIELETGKKRWKKRRSPKFGHGQVMLIGDVILVLTEHGELVLVEVSPEEYRELASMQMLDDDQITWNNPAFAPPYLLVRNAEEAVCYELPLKEVNVVARD